MMEIKLTDSEWKIMDILWNHSPRTIMQLTGELQEKTGWSKNTVITFLKRMESKGAVYFEEGDKAKLYYPNISQKDAARQESQNFLNKVFRGKMGLMLNTMISQDSISDEEIEELQLILQKAKEELNND